MTTSELNQIVELMKQGGPDFKDETSKVRNDFDGLLASLPVDEGLKFETRTIGGIEGIWLTGQEREDRVLLYLHGGAYVVGTAFGYRSLAANIARAAGVSLFSAEYRLAPEHRYPAAIDDALDAYRGLIEEGFAPEQIVVAGDSAGGGLAAALLVALKDAGLQQPAAAWLLSPWADLALSGESVLSKAHEDKLLDGPGLKKTAGDYLNGTDSRTPLASPIYADLSGLAPLFIHVGSREILLDDAVRLAARAGAAGTSARLEIGPGLFHDWPLFAFMLSEGREALAAAGEFLAGRLDAAGELASVSESIEA
ncbi:MAG TPA: alpha/beta hydrolase fold domain-containing protein [Arthrobacter sp.]|nr:alpha/beta hydrolase fold domain-containing protein [Arthrobacter sp.]